MISVAEQFSSLRDTLGSILGIFTALRWLRTIYAKVTGRPRPADATSLTPSAFFSQFPNLASNTTGASGEQTAAKPKPSKKPFIVFLLAVFGMPYLMTKIIRAVSKSQEEQLAQQQLQQQQQQHHTTTPIDPKTLTFCRVLYDFPPPDAVASGAFTPSELDLAVKTGDLVAVLDKSEHGSAEGDSSAWWRCRARDGRIGYIPAVFVEPIQRRQGTGTGSEASSRANTMPESVRSEGTLVESGTGTEDGAGGGAIGSGIGGKGWTGGQSRTKSLNASVGGGGAEGDLKKVGGVPATNGLETFQKAWVPGQ